MTQHTQTRTPAASPKDQTLSNRRQKRKDIIQQANRARHRLLSIRHDVEAFVKPFLSLNSGNDGWPVFVNERCGVWYHENPSRSCYFKSTDGHTGTWNFSLKRLNLGLIHDVSASADGRRGACIVLDSSVRKPMPDALSRTIPIWTAVMNRLVLKYRNEEAAKLLQEEQPIVVANEEIFWDTKLYTPSSCVSKEEHDTIESLLDERVDMVYRSGAVVDRAGLIAKLDRPLRPVWVTPSLGIAAKETKPTVVDVDVDVDDRYYAIICVNCSNYDPANERVFMSSNPRTEFWYTPGAADDHELWARGLTPRLFWNNIDSILSPEQDNDDNAVNAAMDRIVELDRQENDNAEMSELMLSSHSREIFDRIGETNICIGTRRAGRPPECWKHFGAVLNVTTTEYPEMRGEAQDDRFYLQLPVEEGKRDRTELERWMAVGIVFVAVHAAVHNRKVLIHCAQGKDRSVAVAMAAVALLCNPTYPLRMKSMDPTKLKELLALALNNREGRSHDRQGDNLQEHHHYSCFFQESGLPASLVQALLGREGRGVVLQWLQEAPISTKDTLRIVLQLIQQDRPQASPTRSTIQKLNRFFMSQQYGH